MSLAWTRCLRASLRCGSGPAVRKYCREARPPSLPRLVTHHHPATERCGNSPGSKLMAHPVYSWMTRTSRYRASLEVKMLTRGGPPTMTGC